MAHHKSALKRIRQTRKRRLYNRHNKKLVKGAVRAVRESDTFETAAEKLKLAFKVLDQVAARKVFHKNYAANKKSKLAKYVYSLRAAKAE